MVNLNDPLVEALLRVLEGRPSHEVFTAVKRLSLFMDAFGSEWKETPFSVLPSRDAQSLTASETTCSSA